MVIDLAAIRKKNQAVTASRIPQVVSSAMKPAANKVVINSNMPKSMPKVLPAGSMPGNTQIPKTVNPAEVPTYDMGNNPAIRKAPTVATPENPIISKDINEPKDVNTMTKEDLQNYIDTYTIKSKFGTVKEADALEAIKAQRKLNAMMAEEQKNAATNNPYNDLLAKAEAEKAAKAAELKTTSDAGKLAKQAELDSKYATLKAAQEDAGRRKSEAGQRATSTSGFGRSTFNADQQVAIAGETNNALSQLDSAKQAEMAKWEAEQAGADAETLASYESNISEFRKSAYDYQIKALAEADRINKETGLSMEESIKNLMATGKASGLDIKAGDEKTIAMLAQIAIGADGKVNEALLAQLPDGIREIVKAAAQTGYVGEGAFAASDPGQYGQGYIYNKNTGEIKSKLERDTAPDWKVDENGNYYNANAQTVEDLLGGGLNNNNPYAGDPSKTPAIRNNNPGNIKDAGTKGNDGRGFAIFNSPQEGFDALVNKLSNAQIGRSSRAKPNMTLLQYMQKYAPSSDNNNPNAYAQALASGMGVNVNTPISQLDPKAWAKGISKHEDVGMYNIMFSNTPGANKADSKSDQATVDQATSILNDPDLSKSVGPWSYLGNIAGTKQYDFKRKVDNYINNLVLPKLGVLKGPTSDKDIQFIKAAATSLDVGMSEKAFKKALEDMGAVLNKYDENGNQIQNVNNKSTTTNTQTAPKQPTQNKSVAPSNQSAREKALALWK